MQIVFTTCGSRDEAVKLARSAVEEKLAACVQIIPAVESVFEWEGKIQVENEFLLLLKTSGNSYSRLEEFLRENHSYETPEIIAIDASNVSADYSNWLTGVLNNG